jgi:hypothetical protein
MQVTFKRQDATAEQTIDILPDSKLGDSREAVQMLLGLPEYPPCRFVLERTKRELEDSLTFKEAGIKHNDKLILSSPTGQEIKPPQEVPPPPVSSSVPPPITSPIRTQPVSNDWKIAVITGSAIGVFIMLGLVIVKPQNPPPNPSSSPQSPSTSTTQPSEPPKPPISQSISQQEAINLITNWQQAKSRIFAPPFDRQLVASLTTGKVYEDIVKPEGSIDWLQKNNAYYQFRKQEAQATGYFNQVGSIAEVDITIAEEYTLYVNGAIDKSETNFTTYRYTLNLDNGTWKIADRQAKN